MKNLLLALLLSFSSIAFADEGPECADENGVPMECEAEAAE